MPKLTKAMDLTKQRIERVMRETGCGSVLAEDAVEYGYTPRRLGDNGEIGDKALILFDCNGVRAIDTNANPVWESETDPYEFEDMILDQITERPED